VTLHQNKSDKLSVIGHVSLAHWQRAGLMTEGALVRAPQSGGAVVNFFLLKTFLSQQNLRKLRPILKK
jgi:hypothetical protein